MILVALIAVVVVAGHIAEKNDCNAAQGEYNLIKGCSVETYKLGKHAFPGFPKELRDEPRYQSE